jgi:hypothetical protein
MKRRLFVPLTDWWKRRQGDDRGRAGEDAPAGRGECRCLTPPLHYANYRDRVVGTDPTKGRFGEVKVRTCVHCGRLWLHYLVEYEAFSRSGRWYCGVVSEEVARAVSPETAVEILESLPWHLYGGSYFDTTGRRGTGAVHVDL